MSTESRHSRIRGNPARPPQAAIAQPHNRYRHIRVLLAGDHAVTWEGLELIPERSAEFAVVGQARDGVEAVKAASVLSSDVIVMDGVGTCREIMESLPDTRVIMLTASTEADAVIEAVAAGAAGYLQKVAGMK